MEEAPERFISGKKKKRSLKEENGHISMNYAESRRSVTILSHTGGRGGGGRTKRISVFIKKTGKVGETKNPSLVILSAHRLKKFSSIQYFF